MSPLASAAINAPGDFVAEFLLLRPRPVPVPTPPPGALGRPTAAPWSLTPSTGAISPTHRDLFCRTNATLLIGGQSLEHHHGRKNPASSPRTTAASGSPPSSSATTGSGSHSPT